MIQLLKARPYRRHFTCYANFKIPRKSCISLEELYQQKIIYNLMFINNDINIILPTINNL